MTLNILFICEGNAEVFLLYKILREEFKIEIEDKILTNDGNKDDFNRHLRKLNK